MLSAFVVRLTLVSCCWQSERVKCNGQAHR